MWSFRCLTISNGLQRALGSSGVQSMLYIIALLFITGNYVYTIYRRLYTRYEPQKTIAIVYTKLHNLRKKRKTTECQEHGAFEQRRDEKEFLFRLTSTTLADFRFFLSRFLSFLFLRGMSNKRQFYKGVIYETWKCTLYINIIRNILAINKNKCHVVCFLRKE